MWIKSYGWKDGRSEGFAVEIFNFADTCFVLKMRMERKKTWKFFKYQEISFIKKVTSSHFWWMRYFVNDIRWVFGQKFPKKDGCVGGCFIVVQNPRIVLPHISQTPHNVQIILFIDFPLQFHLLISIFSSVEDLEGQWSLLIVSLLQHF